MNFYFAILILNFQFSPFVLATPMSLFPGKELCAECGDLVFFFRNQNDNNNIKNQDQQDPNNDTELREAICAVSSTNFGDTFHVGIIVGSNTNEGGECSEQIVHAAEEQRNNVVRLHCESQVRVQPLADVVADLQPGRVELCRVSAENDPEWRRRAANWAVEQCGSGYNDLFSPECINSKGQRAFYCCQLAVEAYKATNQLAPDSSPFLAHSLNFTGPDGAILPYWIEYYQKLCPQNPNPPQGLPGSHPSKLRASPCVGLVVSKNF